MKFSVETWDPAYGSSAVEVELDPASQEVDASVEVPAPAWGPITPDPGTGPDTILFVDGVRRIDTRVWLTEGDLARPGLCASVAAGVVRCEPGSATIEAAVIERGLYTGAEGAEPIETGHGGTYHLRSVRGDTDSDLYLSIHNHMTELETRVSEEVVASRGRHQLVVFDGPLRHRDNAIGVGYIKTQHVQYLEGPQHRVVAELGQGQRTPLFAIGRNGPAARWSWYLRLPGPISHPLSGIVRLELPGIGEPADAVDRAEAVSAALPRFASEAHKESRSPQNLYPIAGLETQLRRRLGDPHLLERALRLAAVGSG